MPEESKPDQIQTNVSPAPTDVAAETPANQPGDGQAGKTSSTIPADSLPDGTVPTILAPGTTHTSVPKSKASLTKIYRRADVATTLLTFIGAIVACGLILGGYVLLSSKKSQTLAPTKVTTLDKSEMDKLQAFFGGNSAGQSAEVLTVSSSSLFKNRVAIASDLKVVGSAQVSGPTALGDLTVDKTSTLGVTNVRGSLGVAGPVNFQSSAILGGGATINGNLSTSGNGSFGGSLSAGSLSVRDLTISGTLNITHLAVSGQTPSAAPASEAGAGASASVNGNDAAGTVTITTGAIPSSAFNSGGLLVTITFRTPYPRVPRVILTPVGYTGATLGYYVQKTATTFIIGMANNAKSNTTYTFDYWVVQ